MRDRRVLRSGVGPGLLVALAAGGGAIAAAEPYAPAKACASCHKVIHQYWSESAHARSATSKAWEAGLASAEEGTSGQRQCVWCHAPTTLATGDDALKQAITREGITCDFCHTVSSVDLGNAERPFALKPGNTKFGPLEYAKSSFHGTTYSTLHRSSSLLCAACHEHRNAHDVLVLSTYSEWLDSPYPQKGMTCQECHMPLVPGDVVAASRDPGQRRINMHRLIGGSLASQLGSGLTLKIASVEQTSYSAEVVVAVTNNGVGHAAPGGLPTKSLVLVVGCETAAGELKDRREWSYRRDLLGPDGAGLAGPGDMFLKATAVGQDTRIKPNEVRVERLTLPVSAASRAVVARLEYRDASDPSGPPRTTLIAQERRELPAR